MLKRELVVELFESLNKSDLKSAVMYVECLKFMKVAESLESTVKGYKELIKEVAVELNTSKYFMQKVNNIVELAKDTVKFKLHTMEGNSNNIKLFFYNIEKSVSLLKYLTENNTEEVVTNVKNKLNKIKKVADKTVYNDAYAKELKALYKEYKVVLSDEGAIVKVAMSEAGLDKLVNDLTPELRLYLKNKLSIIAS